MIFAPARLGSVTLDNETLAADKKGCRRFGPCGVGEKALYLNSFFIDRHYYVALESVRRVFKRVAMSKGGFTGKGAFGSIPYLVVEYDGGEKQCNFKHEEDVDNLLAYLSKLCPDLPLQSQKVERHMAQQQAQEARRYLKELTPQAQSEKERLEQARAFLEDHTNLTLPPVPGRPRPSGSMTAPIPAISGWPWPSLSPGLLPWYTAWYP